MTQRVEIILNCGASIELLTDAEVTDIFDDIMAEKPFLFFSNAAIAKNQISAIVILGKKTCEKIPFKELTEL